MAHSILSINIKDLLQFRGVESSRIEFKASWDPKVVGYQVLHTVCAFANDFQNLNGGYIVLGVAEEGGRAILPPNGLAVETLDDIQKWIRGHCKQLDPVYQPVFSPEVVEGRLLLVIWAPGGDTRPYKAPVAAKEKGKKYYVRIGSETVDAEANGLLPQLLELTARVPFDDRLALQARVEDMRFAKVMEFLRNVNSGLAEETDAQALYRRLRIARPVNAHDAPVNVGLILFSEDAESWFQGARIEVVQFIEGTSGNVIEEKYFRGDIYAQLKNCLEYLESFSSSYTEKRSQHALAHGWVSYPSLALREAVVNAVYHRSYETREPVKINLYSDRMEIISYPGPIAGIELEHLNQQKPMPPFPARNRRIGEFLKELRMAEGRGTGLPKIFSAMQANGSPAPQFDFDAARSYFRVILPAHPEYAAITVLRDVAYLESKGDPIAALKKLEEGWNRNKKSSAITGELLSKLVAGGKFTAAKTVYASFKAETPPMFCGVVLNRYIEALLEAHKDAEAAKLLGDMPKEASARETLDFAISCKRLKKYGNAHRYFEKIEKFLSEDPKGLHEFAQTKMQLATKLYSEHLLHIPQKREAYNRLLHEAMGQLGRVVQLTDADARRAWAYRDLARVKRWLGFPRKEIESDYRRAINLLPEERTFRQELERFNINKKAGR